MEKKHYNVVAAVVCRRDRILCVQKGQTKYEYTSFKYEFPGGKIEPNEKPEEALQREMSEELKYQITVGKAIMTIEYEYPDFSISLTAFYCTADDESFTLTEHVDARWMKVKDLHLLQWAEADERLIRYLETEMLNNN